MQIRCPHCHHPVEVVDERLLESAVCPSCGSNFSLVGPDATISHRAMGPRRLGHFELTEQVGIGSFGTVWKARDTVLDRVVALKVPRRGQLEAAEVEFFFRDARAAAQLCHASIVSVHEVGRDGETVFIASDFIDGANLKDWLTARRLTIREAAQLVAEIAEALHHAHERGVVHRDLKPGNILMDSRGRPHVTDFGLAKRETGEVTMTVDGQILGTPAYMSPEQARGKAHEANAASDVYSLGVILFELMTGELPFRGENRMLIMQILNDEPPHPRRLNSRVSRDLQTICLKCLEKDPRRRYESAHALAEDLERALRNEPIRARPVGHVERLWRWSKRQPVVASLTAAVLLSLTAGAVLSACFAWNESIQRARAVAGKRIADDRLELANQAVSSMLIEVGAETLKNVPQMESVRAALLDKALLLYEKIGQTRDAEDEFSRHEVAIANFQVGEIRRTLGQDADAEEAYRKAIGQLGALTLDFPAHPPYRQELARSYMWLGELLRTAHGTSRAEEAEQNHDAAIKIQSDLVSLVLDEKQSQYKIELARSHMIRGILRKDRGLNQKLKRQPADAQRSFDQAKHDYDQAESYCSQLLVSPVQSDVQHEERRVLLTQTHVNRGVLLHSQLDHENPDPQLLEAARQAYLKAIAELNTVIAECRRRGQTEPLGYQLDLARYYNNLANVLMDDMSPDHQNEVAGYNDIALRLGTELNLGTPEVREELANFYNTKAVFLERAKQTEQAVLQWEKAADVLETVWRQNRHEEVTELLGKHLCNICYFYQALDQHAKAIHSIDRLASLRCNKSRFEKAASYMDSGRSLVQEKHPALADQYQERARVFREKAQAAD